MVSFSTARRTALTGYAFAAAGILLYTELDRIVDLRMGDNVLNAAAVGSMAATLGGCVTAIVGSAIWAQRSPTRQPLKIATYAGVGSVFVSLIVGVNVHGPSAMLMFLMMFSVINVLTQFVASGW
ncbi:MAG: hypothetical protein ABSA27_08105 [Terriglobales bacterium]|jgi:hypothetical protein